MENQKTFPMEILPECWNDDVRMAVLFSPFREKKVNPENYDGKMIFWQEMIVKYCLWKGQARVTVPEIENAARRNEKKPYCIENVFQEMINTGQMERKSDFMVLPEPTWTGWLSNFPKRSTVMVLQKFKNLFFPDKRTSTVFVVKEVAEIHADKVFNLLENQIISRSKAFNSAREKLNLSEEGFTLAIHGLVCQQKVAMRSLEKASQDDFVLKFASSGEKITVIADMEFSIYQMETMEVELTKIVNELEAEAQKFGEKAREHVKKSERALALLNLKMRKKALRNLEQRTKNIMNLQEMLETIHNVKMNKKIMQVYQMGGKSLQDVLEKEGITREKVEAALDDVRDSIDQANAVDAALGQDVTASTSAEDAELEKELDDLLKEDEVAKKDDEIIKEMQRLHVQVPSDHPSPESSREWEHSQH